MIARSVTFKTRRVLGIRSMFKDDRKCENCLRIILRSSANRAQGSLLLKLFYNSTNTCCTMIRFQPSTMIAIIAMLQNLTVTVTILLNSCTERINVVTGRQNCVQDNLPGNVRVYLKSFLYRTLDAASASALVTHFRCVALL